MPRNYSPFLRKYAAYEAISKCYSEMNVDRKVQSYSKSDAFEKIAERRLSRIKLFKENCCSVPVKSAGESTAKCS